MTQPTNYTPTTDFSQQESINASGRSTVNTAALDAEFANIETTLDQTVSNLSLIQRDDGRLKDVSVEIHTISPEVLNLIGGGYALRGLWSAATAYAVNDICSNGAYTYVCRTAHTSGGSFDGQYWTQFGFTSGADAAAAAAAAQSSATSAAGSATAAGNSAMAAAGSASSISGVASSALASALTATTKAGEASASAVNAAASASAAALISDGWQGNNNVFTGANSFVGNVEVYGTLVMGSAFGSRNLIYNGAMPVSQRGTTFTPTLGAMRIVDGFTVYSEGAAPASPSQAFTPSGTFADGASPYCFVAYGAAGNTGMNIFHRVESINSARVRAKQVTFSAWVYTQDSRAVTFVAEFPNAQDTWGPSTGIGSVGMPASIGWRKHSFTFTAPITNTGLAVSIQFGAVPAGIQFGTTLWQLEEGTVATPFEHPPYGLELALCKRYARVYATPQNVADLAFDMRATPTASGSGPYLYVSEL